MRGYCKTQPRAGQPSLLTAGLRSMLAAAALVLAACGTEPGPGAPPLAVELHPAFDPFWVILFEPGRSDLTGNGGIIVAQVAEAMRGRPDMGLILVGHTDSLGASDGNLRLSRARAAAVRDALVAAGMSQERIIIEGRGETELAVPTGDGVGNPANRRVTIRGCTACL